MLQMKRNASVKQHSSSGYVAGVWEDISQMERMIEDEQGHEEMQTKAKD